MNNIIILIIGMTLVTYIPRLLPFLMISNRKMPTQLEKFLKLIPYTALGALIFPGGLNAISNYPIVSIISLTLAFIFAWKKGGIIVPVLGSISITYFLLIIVK